MNDSDAEGLRSRKDRSPSFPFISLPRAMERVRALADSHKRSTARLAMIAPTWGYGLKSSGLLQTVAALKQFGLIDDVGSGDDRRVVLSDLSWKVLMDSRPGAKEQALREAALRPRLISEYAQHWLPERPSDSHCLSELHLDRGFTLEAAKTFLKVFDETVAFVGLIAPDSMSQSSANDAVAVEEAKIEVGDFVVAPSGPFEFSDARRVTDIRHSITGAHAAHLENTQNPIPVSQLRIVRKGLQGVAFPFGLAPGSSTYGSNVHGLAHQPTQAFAGVSRATFPLPEGLVALELPGTLSEESYEDLKAWIDVMLRRAKRSISMKDGDET